MEPFRHVDRDQTIVFGPGALAAADDLLGEGYTLLTTERARGDAPALAERAGAVVLVPAGFVDEVAADLLDAVPGERLVALGGGRVVDVAKAVAAAHRWPGPIAVPTTLSGAEMTWSHRHARGVAPDTPRVGASVVVNDPALSASAPEDQLAASSGNALAHAVTAVVTTRATPMATAVAHEAIRHLVTGWKTVDREAIALGALLCGWAVDRAGLGPHHVLSQTAVRLAGVSHAHANVALLPHTLAAYRDRVPGALDDAVLDLAVALRDRAGAHGLGDASARDAMVEAAAAREAELARVPPALTAREIRALYAAAAAS